MMMSDNQVGVVNELVYVKGNKSELMILDSDIDDVKIDEKS